MELPGEGHGGGDDRPVIYTMVDSGPMPLRHRVSSAACQRIREP